MHDRITPGLAGTELVQRIGYRKLAKALRYFLLWSLLAVIPLKEASAVRIDVVQQSSRGGGNDREKDTRTLEPGKPIRRELAGGQQHRYQVELSLNQLLKSTVRQDGIDVVVNVVGPDSRQLATFDSISKP